MEGEGWGHTVCLPDVKLNTARAVVSFAGVNVYLTEIGYNSYARSAQILNFLVVAVKNHGNFDSKNNNWKLANLDKVSKFCVRPPKRTSPLKILSIGTVCNIY